MCKTPEESFGRGKNLWNKSGDPCPEKGPKGSRGILFGTLQSSRKKNLLRRWKVDENERVMRMQLRGTAKNARTTNSLFALRIGLATKRPVSWISHFRRERKAYIHPPFSKSIFRSVFTFSLKFYYTALHAPSETGKVGAGASRERRRVSGDARRKVARSLIGIQRATRFCFSFTTFFPNISSSRNREKAPF